MSVERHDRRLLVTTVLEKDHPHPKSEIHSASFFIRLLVSLTVLLDKQS